AGRGARGPCEHEEGEDRARRGRANRAPLADSRRRRGGARAGGREQYRPRADPAGPLSEARDGGARTTRSGLPALRQLPPPEARAQFAERSLNPLRLRPAPLSPRAASRSGATSIHSHSHLSPEVAMPPVSETTLRAWATGPRQTEADKCANAERAVRKAI